MRRLLCAALLCACHKPVSRDAVPDAAPVLVEAGSTELPPEWPKAVPMYPGTKVFSVEPAPGGGLEVRGEAPGSPRKVAAFYRGVLQGFQVAEDELNLSDQQAFTFSRGGKPMVSVLVSGPEESGLVVLVLDAAMLTPR